MPENIKEIVLAVSVALSTLVYMMFVVRMIKKTNLSSTMFRIFFGSPSASERREKFYEMLLKSLENGLVNSLDDIINIYSGITGFSYGPEEKRHYLGKRLRGFLVYMLKQDGIEKEKLKTWKDIVTGFINELETEVPYADVPSSERRLLLEIDRLITSKEYSGIKGRIDDLAGMIQNRSEDQSRTIKINRLSVPLTIVGLILTFVFGGLSLYLAFRPLKEVVAPTTPVQQSQKTTEQISGNTQNQSMNK
jgi:hypothetical protein